MIRTFFAAWERQLASVDTDRVVRPFDWGLDWLGITPSAGGPLHDLLTWSAQTTAHSGEFFHSEPTDAFELRDDLLRFPSAIRTPFESNNTVVARVFRPTQDARTGPRRAVVVLPQWNADGGGHVGLCRLFTRFGLTAVRLSLPYHEMRRPPHLSRADYMVSANIGRTVQANRQAVLDARRIVDWLEREGYERIGIMGTSLGSCLAMLTMAHDDRIRAGAFNHVSPYFADVVWRGLSTQHVRAGLDGHVMLEELRRCWMPISPWPFVSNVRGRNILLVYARYDDTFPVDLSRAFVAEFDRQRVAHDVTVLPCGHYTTGKTPFKYLDGFALTRFFVRRL
jgi:Alpha/beta hydrolase domain containing 18